MANSRCYAYGSLQDVNLEDAVRRAEIERSAAIRKGLRRLWSASPFGRAAAKPMR